MATFECKVYELTIEEHPNADALELARVGDYLCIVGKGQFQTGDVAVYIPEAAIVPPWLLVELGLVDKLVGKDKNRVKAMKLRGIVSQGLVYAPISQERDSDGEYVFKTYLEDVDQLGYRSDVKVGTDLTEFLGITKYEPPIPSGMSGEVFNAFGYTINFDIENIKKYPDILVEGEEISVTEKLHGTWCCFGHHPDVDCAIVTSKGQSAKGLAFKHNESNDRNLYMQMYRQLTDESNRDIVQQFIDIQGDGFLEPFYILGEVYGKGVQDLAYVDDNQKHFRVFDIYVGEPTNGRYLSPNEVEEICRALDIDMVPVLYYGPYIKAVIENLTNGKETVSGKELHMREGVVIRPFNERRHDEIGRVILKSVSDAYLLRKGGTEFN
jgi:RNA ligase (TIGR02306 family)